MHKHHVIIPKDSSSLDQKAERAYQLIKGRKDKYGKSMLCNKWLNDRANFYEWYKRQQQECSYCHLPGDTKLYYERWFHPRENKKTGKVDYLRGRNLEVDRKNAKGKYSPDNCILACYPCNNAKSDVFSYSEFKEIGKTISLIKISQAKHPNRLNFLESNSHGGQTMKRPLIYPPLHNDFDSVFMKLSKQPNSCSLKLATTSGVIFVAEAKITRDGRPFISLPHNNRIYKGDWGYSANNMGKSGQWIGQYAISLDKWVL